MNVMTEVSDAKDLGFSKERLELIPAFFQSYLDKKKLAGYSVLLARGGEVALQTSQGMMDWDTGQPMADDTIFRIYSMSKPITSVALMMLYEEGKFQLGHDVHRYIPEFKDLRVFDEGWAEQYTTREPDRPMMIIDLLRHTSGLSYDFQYGGVVDELYRLHRVPGVRGEDATLSEFTQQLSKLPLKFSPGTKWNYSVSTDVCGRLVEILSGKTLDVFLKERILDPLGMVDTGFHVREGEAHRFATCYEKNPVTRAVELQDKASESRYLKPRQFLSGGGGLVSTIGDYFRFCKMILNGGELDGARLLSPTTIDFMSLNHLPENQTMKDMGDNLFSESRTDGAGFGLGFSVVIDQARDMSAESVGSLSWGGMASTRFWVDPAEDLIGIFMTQLMPSATYPLSEQLKQLTYAAITE